MAVESETYEDKSDRLLSRARRCA